MTSEGDDDGECTIYIMMSSREQLEMYEEQSSRTRDRATGMQ